MRIEKLKARKHELESQLMSITNRVQQWQMKQNAAEKEVKRLEASRVDEHQKHLLGQPNKLDHVSSEFSKALHKLEVCQAQLRTMQLSVKDVEERGRLKEQLNQNSKSNLHAGHGERERIQQEAERIYLRISEIEAKAETKEADAIEAKLYAELAVIKRDMGLYVEYRHSMKDLGMGISIAMADIWQKASKFEDVDHFNSEFNKACEGVLKS